MLQSMTLSVNVSRRAVFLSGSALLLVVLALSVLIATHQPRTTPHHVTGASSAVSTDAGSSARLPGRLSYRAEHSVCAAQLTDLAAVANADDANTSARLPGRVYYHLVFQSASCA